MPENITIECPFCHKKTIKAIYYPPVLQTTTSHAAGRAVTKYYYTKEKYEILSGCSNCGKSLKEVKRALREGKKSKEKEKRIIERLKAEGIFKETIKTKF